MKEKVRKEYLGGRIKFLENKSCNKNHIKGINTWVVLLCEILMTFLKMDKEGIQINGPKNKEINNDAQGLTLER